MRILALISLCLLSILGALAVSPTLSSGGGGVSSLISKAEFEQMLKHRNDAACEGNGFYTYEAFIAAADAFDGFGTTGDNDTKKREIAAFFAQTSHETTGGFSTAPDGPYAWGYCCVTEQGDPPDYCVADIQQYPCTPVKKYFGRGPFQITYNYNYGPAGIAIGIDLLRLPDLVATDPIISFKTALWFWMTPQYPKPSCHDVITGRWTPSAAHLAAGLVPGYGVITNIINGGIECGRGSNPLQEDRIGFYKRYTLRTVPFPASSLLKNRQAVVQSEIPNPLPKPHRFPNKTPKKNPPQTSKLPTISFTSPSLSDAKTLFNSLINSTPADLKFHNSLLQSYAAVSSLDDATSLLRHMTKTHPAFSPDHSTYQVLLTKSCYSPDPNLTAVRKTLNLMAAEGFPPDKATTDVAVRSLCNAGRLEHAVELVKEFCLKNSPPDSVTYNFLIKHLCRTRTVSSVNGFIKEMRESFAVKPDLVSYTILIDNVCNRKNLREATRLLGLLSEDGFKPDCYVYNIVMKGYCMLSQGSEVLWVYKKMKEEGVEPDMVTYNTLIFGLSKSGRAKEARKFLGVMAEMGLSPDEVTYTSLMNGMCREGNASGALELLEEMEAKGCSPNSCTYNTLLHGLCKAKLLGKAIELYGVMKAGDVKLETGSYGTFLRTLCRNGRVAEAYEVFDYAVESKSLKDVVAYSTLESILKWLKKAKEQGLAV
ncbi:hypothetical protein RHSIM_Rhsim10G0201800 [Rhododendron simsii]|uniref:Glycoside hydrolase family 19 catalytic domain-containing protein n=1 Tax=Rhododendron simsii TaxID=118357 RepID=A0A834LDM6_RHOSS|nr:hypothetical protein RHSIM_Rhsim10G0201800 [Rhododendron simsii]